MEEELKIEEMKKMKKMGFEFSSLKLKYLMKILVLNSPN